MIPGSGYFGRRWRGEVALGQLLWRDMVGLGTAVNLIASFAALMLVAQGVDLRVAAVLHFAPLPYNLFLFLAVWRSPRRNPVQSVTAVCWLVAMTVV